jgi:hypothetical protein
MKNPSPRSKWSPDSWIALSAMIVALCALILSVIEGRATRKHARLSVRPLVTISGTVNEHGSGWKLGNAGLGPALVRWFEVSVDGRPVRNWLEFEEAVGLPQGTQFRYWVPQRATAFPPQEPRELFWVMPGPADQALRTTKAKITMRMCYCSMYEECWLATGGPNIPPYQSCPEEPSVLFQAHPPAVSSSQSRISTKP